MIDTLKTSFSFAKNLLTVGAFKETSPETVIETCSKLKSNKKLRFRVINDSALNFKNYVLEEVDNFIISIPFTFLKNKEAEKLVKSCFDLLSEDGIYS